MNIKERIDALTEQEAKAALQFCVKYFSVVSWCHECPFKISCPEGIVNNEHEVEECGWQFLTGVIKEARKCK